MKTRLFFLFGICLLCLDLLLGARALFKIQKQGTKLGIVNRVASPQVASQRILSGYGKLPLSFEANRGQTDGQVRFLSRGSGYTLFLTSDDAVLALQTSKSKNKYQTAKIKDKDALLITSNPEARIPSPAPENPAVLRMKLIGANTAAEVAGLQELPVKTNYFIGNDPAKWRRNVPTYAKVREKDVYPGIDLVYYGNQRQLEYDFLVAPGANPATITLGFEGADALKIAPQGDLWLNADGLQICLHKPLIYQETNGTKLAIPGGYVLRGGQKVGFQVAAYDTRKRLIIDPVLSYSTYIGGTGSDGGTGIAVDSSGNAYVTGLTSSLDFPTKAPFQANPGGSGNNDAFVAKLDATGSALVYSTYLGGSNFDEGSGIALDPGCGGPPPAAQCNAYVTGITNSADFPTTIGAFRTAIGGPPFSQRAFVTKLNPTGSALVYSTYLGGTSQDQGTGIAVDGSGNAYVTGSTNSTDFPTANPVRGFGGGKCVGYYFSGACQDAFVTKLNPAGSALVYSTYLGGNQSDQGYGIALDSVGNAYVTGSTSSTDFPTAIPLQPFGGGTCNGYYFTGPCSDTFVAKLNPAGSALIFSTYLGGSNADTGSSIAVDSSGSAYVTGMTSSTDFPTKNPLQPAYGGSGDAFVAKLNPAGSALVYSTYLGASRFDHGRGIAVDFSGNAYVMGITNSIDFGTIFPVQALNDGRHHTFITSLNPAGSFLTFSTYLGGSNDDNGSSIAVDATGNAYLTGSTTSTNFPTANPLQASLKGFSNAFVSKIDVTIPGPAVMTSPASLSFDQQPINTTSPPQTVTLTNRGDGSLTITNIAANGDFALTNTCGGGVIAAGGSCAINVTFTPTASGTRRGTVTISDNAPGSPRTLPLVGNFAPPDFSISASPTTATVSAGGTATFTITVVSLNDFTGRVNLGCDGQKLPPQATCSLSPLPPPFVTANSSTTSTLTISTTKGSALLAPPFEGPRITPLYAFCLLLLGMALAAVGMRRGKSKKLRIGSISVGLLIILAALQAGCGGGKPPTPATPGTPRGTYDIPVAGTFGQLQHSTTVTVTVN
jgi:hypothetical protein